jgi:hypothetical protein
MEKNIKRAEGLFTINQNYENNPELPVSRGHIDLLPTLHNMAEQEKRK